ncbi:MAG: aminoglycoside 6-adenylyltransferase [Streptococcus parasanguinis]
MSLTFPVLSASGPLQPTEEEFAASCNEFWWVSAYVVKAIRRNQLIYATDHLYGICQQELLKVLAWQVTSDKGVVDIGKNYKYLFQYLPAEQEKEFSALLDLSSFDKITQSLFSYHEGYSHREAQILAQKMGFTYDKEVAEKMMTYAKEKLSNHSVNKAKSYFKLQKGSFGYLV